MPNVCKMPGPPAPFVPTPLPNIGKSGKNPKGFSTTVTIEGKAVAIRGASFESVGDIASKGLGGGIVSSNCEGPTTFVGPGSTNVQIEGKNVQYLGDPMLNNNGPGGSPANSATMTGVVHPPLPMDVILEILCSIFCECLAEGRAKKVEVLLPDVSVVEEPGFDPPSKPGRSANQDCVEKKFNKEYKHAMSNVKAEQSFDMTKTPPAALPDSMRGMPGTRRPDFTVSGTPPTVIEMKFPGDRYRGRQKEDYRKIGGGKEPITLTKKSCRC
jgi:uncharacterized Zn-binding protein involved in type VI secretion